MCVCARYRKVSHRCYKRRNERLGVRQGEGGCNHQYHERGFDILTPNNDDRDDEDVNGPARRE